MFSNLTHNALNALMLVAQHQPSGPVTTEFISRHLGLSISYLESLMSSLKKKEFVISYRGPGGGYCTMGRTDDIKVLDVINAFEPSPPLPSDAPSGELDKDLITHLVADFIAQQLRDVSLQQVLSQLPAHARCEPLSSPMVRQEAKPRFKPLKIHKLPSGPNSVFNLAQSMAM